MAPMAQARSLRESEKSLAERGPPGCRFRKEQIRLQTVFGKLSGNRCGKQVWGSCQGEVVSRFRHVRSIISNRPGLDQTKTVSAALFPFRSVNGGRSPAQATPPEWPSGPSRQELLWDLRRLAPLSRICLWKGASQRLRMESDRILPALPRIDSSLGQIIL